MTTPQSEEQPQPAPSPHLPVVSLEPRAAPAQVLEFEESLLLDKLAGALAKAQGGMAGAKKDSEGQVGQQKVKYADLASVWDVIRKPLSENGLAIIQRPSARQSSVTVVTDMVHESGQWIRMRLTLPLDRQTAQGVGSAITYARRYSISALTGVAAEDDDDGAAASGEPPQRRSDPPPDRPATKPGESPAELKAKAAAEAARKQLAVRVKRLWTRAQEEKQLNEEGWRRWYIGVLGVEKTSGDWTAEEVAKLEAAFA